MMAMVVAAFSQSRGNSSNAFFNTSRVLGVKIDGLLPNENEEREREREKD